MFDVLSSTNTMITIIYFCIVSFNVFIIFPFTIYYCHKIWTLRNEYFFSKRYPLLTIVTVMIFAVQNFILRPICDIPKLFQHLRFRFNTSMYLYPYSTHFPLALLCLRLFFLFYDYNHGLQIVSNEWSSKLNGDENILHKHWTIKYHKCFRKYSNLLYYLSILYVILAEGFSLIISQFDFFIGNLVYHAFTVILLILLIIMAIKVRPCRDELHIRAEFKLLCIPAIILAVLYVVILTLFDFDSPLRAIVFYIGLSIVFGNESYVSTKWIIDQHQKRILDNKNYSSLTNTNKPAIKLNDVFKNKDAFDLFAFQLVKEFCIENLMFLYESNQVKEQCLAWGLIEEENVGRCFQFGKETTSKIHIVDIPSFSESVQYIVHKYINEGAEYCINIPSYTRAKIKLFVPQKNQKIRSNLSDEAIMIQIASTKKEDYKKFSKENVCVFIKELNEAIETIHVLLSADSLVRFCRTDKFKQIFTTQ